MGRCSECSACKVVLEARKTFGGTNKNNKNKVKRAERQNKCENPTPLLKKRRINEVENLHSSGQGGRIQFEVFPPPSLAELQLDPADRAARPGDLTEAPISDDAEHDEYLRVVSLCTEAANSSSSLDVLAEAKSMIPKMRKLLDPKLRDEVDFSEATKDCSNIHRKWLNNQAAGRRAFIPDDNDRDECYSALRIYSCALEESKLIPLEYEDMWGEEGYWIYKTMLDNIGERDKRSLPFVNMCLRSWMRRLAEDGNLWPEMDSLDYDVWLAKEVRSRGKDHQAGKTSFQLMMAAFGSYAPPVGKSSSAATSIVGTTSEPVAKVSGTTRTSKLQRLSNDLRNKILIASTLRNKKENATQADKTLLEADPNYAIVEHSRAIKKACADAAKRMEDLLFTTGGADRLLSTLKYFRDRPAIRELNCLNKLSNNGGSDSDKSNRKNQTETLNSFIAKNLKGFLNFFKKKGKGAEIG